MIVNETFKRTISLIKLKSMRFSYKCTDGFADG